MCTRSSDAALHQRLGEERWQAEVLAHGLSQVWRDDVLPCRPYLRHCVLAALALGDDVLDSVS